MSDDLIKRSDVLFMIDAFERDFEQSWRVQFRANIDAIPAVKDDRIDMEQIIEDYKADLKMAQDLLVSAVWLLQDAMVQLEDGKIKTRRNRAAIIRQFLTKITLDGNK